MMHNDRENAIKILSSLSPSIREAIAVFIETTSRRPSDPVENIANNIRHLSK